MARARDLGGACAAGAARASSLVLRRRLAGGLLLLPVLLVLQLASSYGWCLWGSRASAPRHRSARVPRAAAVADRGQPPDWFRQVRDSAQAGGSVGAPGIGGGAWGDLEGQAAVQVPVGENPWRKLPTTTHDWYRALTKINIRAEPDTRSARLGTSIAEGQVFEVNAELAVTGQKFLKLAKQDGWVFARGVAGDWVGKEIVKRT